MYKVEANIPLPLVTRARRKGTTIYPFTIMKIGESFLIPIGGLTPLNEKEVERLMKNRISAATTAYRKAYQRTSRFIGRLAVKENGYRVWRVS